MKRLLKLSMTAAALVAVPSIACAEGGGQTGFQISLTIPEICDIEASSVLIEGSDGQVTVNVFEMCNSGRGFRVLASHRALEPTEQVRVNYAGQLTDLSPTGMSEVAFRQGPMVRSVPVAIQATALTQGIAISFGMTAI